MYMTTYYFLVVTNRWLLEGFIDACLFVVFSIKQNLSRLGGLYEFGVPYIFYCSLSSLAAYSRNSVTLFYVLIGN